MLYQYFVAVVAVVSEHCVRKSLVRTACYFTRAIQVRKKIVKPRQVPVVGLRDRVAIIWARLYSQVKSGGRATRYATA